MTNEQYNQNVETLKKWAYAYYVEDNPIATDEEYDRLYHEVLAYELSKSLDYGKKTVRTPLGNKKTYLSSDKLVLCSVLRAGLPLHHGILNYFDGAENAFISAYRNHPYNDDDFEVIVNYFAAPSLDNKILVLTDPMLATGKTLENVLNALKGHGSPKQIHIISVIGSKTGVAKVADGANPI